MRFSYIQTAIVLSLFGLQQTAGAPLGRYSIQRGDKYGASTAAYYIDERTPRGASIKARGDKDQKQNQLSNKPSSGKPSTSAGKPPSSAEKPTPPAGKPAASAGKPPGGQSAASSSKRPNWPTKPLDFNPFNSKDSDYPYILSQPEQTKTSEYDRTLYEMWDVTKKSGEYKKPYVDQFGFALGGKNIVIKSAENKADKPINGKKASLAELLAAYKYNSKEQYDPKNLQVIRIQDIQEEETRDTMIRIEKDMNPELEKPAEKADFNPERGSMSDAEWRVKKNELRKMQQAAMAKKDKSRPRPARITKFDLSDTSNPKLYQDIKNSVWGQSVERICRKFGKRIVRVHVNMAEPQSFLIFYLA